MIQYINDSAIDVVGKNQGIYEHLRRSRVNDLAQKLKANDSSPSGSIFTARQLEYVEAQALSVKYADLKAFELFPVDSSIPVGRATVTYNIIDSVGEPVIVTSNSNIEVPNISIASRQITFDIEEFSLAYTFTTQDLERANSNNMNLNSMLAMGTVESMEKGLEAYAWNGGKYSSTAGIMNNPDIPRTNSTTGVSGFADFGNLTPSEIYEVCLKAIRDVSVNSKACETANTLIMSVETYGYLLRNYSENNTILEQLYKVSKPGFRIEQVPYLENIGTGNTNVLIAYDRNPQKLKFVIPRRKEFGMPTFFNESWKTHVKSSTAGVIMLYPKSMNIVEGV